MLYSVRGRVTKDGNQYPFRSRIEGPNAIAACSTVVTALRDQKVEDDAIAELHATPMKGKSAVSIGTKPIVPTTPAAPAAKSKKK